MYLRSLIVVALCTAFVIGFALVLNFEQGAVLRSLNAGVQTSHSTCVAGSGCDILFISSATLREKNYTSDLGPGSYATLFMKLNVTGASSLNGLKLFVDNTSAGTVRGPIGPGADIVVNVTLPSTIAVAHGNTYTLAVEGLYGADSTAWQTAKVIAQ
jgi:hypothetical protein